MLSILNDRDLFGNPLQAWTRYLETPTQFEAAFEPTSEIEETETHFLMHVDLPGVPKKDIAISFEDGRLTVSGERKLERKTKTMSERSYGKFVRSFSLPTDVQAEKIEANYENGVLTVAVPKGEAVKPRQIKISEGKSSLSPTEETH